MTVDLHKRYGLSFSPLEVTLSMDEGVYVLIIFETHSSPARLLSFLCVLIFSSQVCKLEKFCNSLYVCFRVGKGKKRSSTYL